MDDYISILQKMLNKFDQKPDVYGKLLTLEAKNIERQMQLWK